MRTRTRLLLSFLIVHGLLTLVGALIAYAAVDRFLRQQAEASAVSVGRVLAQGGFALNEQVLARMRELSKHDFRLLPLGTPARAGTVQVTPQGLVGTVIEIDYQTADYRRASRLVVLVAGGAFVVGVAVFALVAAWLARQFARPLERLAEAARTIGEDDLHTAVPQFGGENGSGEIAQLARELEHMRVRLRDLDREHRRSEHLTTLGTFTATIAHEVRNPLSAVRLTVQLLAKKHADDPSLRLITDELERLDLIVDELLGYAKGMSVRAENCAVRVVADDVVRLLSRQAAHAGVSLIVIGDATLRVDPARLRQLLMNLILNAVQALHGQTADDVDGSGTVTVRIEVDGLAVEDHGPGVAPALIPELFAPFVSQRAGGTGLGLSLARAIAEAHGAKLSYEAVTPHGSRFVLRGLLPAG